MLLRTFVVSTLRALDWLAARTLLRDQAPAHQLTGRRGEEAAHFHLRKIGYTIIARNFRLLCCRGEIDPIGWDKDVLCFIEVRTRSRRDVKPGEAAVDQGKRRVVAAVVRDYLRLLPQQCQWRFDVVSVYYEAKTKTGAPRLASLAKLGNQPQIEVFRNSSLTA